jgi:glycosyltransferase involved in cell wall biosynthesis
MKVSIIIPAYNEEKRVGKALTALLAQNYTDFEIIVVDNASSDRTAEIAKKFPVKVVSESRKGTMWACERGRKDASGDIIVRMDADCEPEPDWLRKGVSFFQDNSVAAVSGPYEFSDGSIFFKTTSLISQKTFYVLTNTITQLFNLGGVMLGGNSFMRSDALKKAGGFNTAITFYGDDADTAKRLSHHGRIIFSPRVVMKTSARRFENEGTLRTSGRYLFYFFKTIISKDQGQCHKC